jgi:hypothetical protein
MASTYCLCSSFFVNSNPLPTTINRYLCVSSAPISWDVRLCICLGYFPSLCFELPMNIYFKSKPVSFRFYLIWKKGQTVQWRKERNKNKNTNADKTLHRKLQIEGRCSGREDSSCSLSAPIVVLPFMYILKYVI